MIALMLLDIDIANHYCAENESEPSWREATNKQFFEDDQFAKSIYKYEETSKHSLPLQQTWQCIGVLSGWCLILAWTHQESGDQWSERGREVCGREKSVAQSERYFFNSTTYEAKENATDVENTLKLTNSCACVPSRWQFTTHCRTYTAWHVLL